jgi:translocator protein
MLRLDWFGGIALAALLLFPIGGSPATKESREFYDELRRRAPIPIMPPGWLFGPVWFLLYILMSAAIVLWSHEADQESWLWLAIWITAVVNFALNKLWSLIFFSYKLLRLAAVDAVGIWISAVLVLIFMCLREHSDDPVLTNATNSSSSFSVVDDDLTARRIVAIVFWSVYVAWSTFATVLSIWIDQRNQGYFELPQLEPMTAN